MEFGHFDVERQWVSGTSNHDTPESFVVRFYFRCLRLSVRFQKETGEDGNIESQGKKGLRSVSLIFGIRGSVSIFGLLGEVGFRLVLWIL